MSLKGKNLILYDTASANYYIANNNQGLRVKNTSGNPTEIIYLNTSNQTVLPNANVIINKNLGIGGAPTSYKLTAYGDIYANEGWLRTSGSHGWYNESYGGGWYMIDSTYIRNYGSRKLYLDNGIYFVENKPSLCFRDGNSNYYTDIIYGTNGNEALSFITKAAVTSFMFINGSDPKEWNSGTWNTVTPSMQIKQNCVYINERIPSGTTPIYNFKVNGYAQFTKTVDVTTTACTWIDGQKKVDVAALNLNTINNTNSYWPWIRQTNNGSGKLFSIGVLNNSLYVLGSSTSRTANSYEVGWQFNMSDGYLYGNFCGSLSGNASSATYLKDKTNNTASYLDYGASALSNPTYLAGWDGYTLRAVNRSNLSVNYASSAGSVSWGNVSGKPSTYPPSSHSHWSVEHSSETMRLLSPDTRSSTWTPRQVPTGMSLNFKSSGVIGFPISGYTGLMDWRSYGNSSDLSGGPVMEIGYGEDGQLYRRYSTGASSWSGWRMIFNGSWGSNLPNGAQHNGEIFYKLI